MGAFARWAQLVGLVLFAAAAFLPAHANLEHPAHPRVAELPALVVAGRAETPAYVLAEAARRDVREGPAGLHLWEVRRWYPFALAPVWLLALGTVVLWPRLRSWVGGALLVLALGLAVFEACYLAVEYAPLFPQLLGRGETLLVWAMVVLVLFARRAGDRALEAVEAHVSAQALLCWMHLLTLPATEARPWWEAHPVQDVVSALGTNFRPAFWTALVALMLAFLPTYLRRRGAGPRAPGLGSTLDARPEERPEERPEAGPESLTV